MLFALSLIASWVLRDYGEALLSKASWIANYAIHKDPGADHKAFFGSQAVYRLAFGTTLFYGFHAALLYKVKLRSDPRDRWVHHGGWFIKLPIYIFFVAVPFLFPNGAIEGFTWVARVFGGVFLVLQMVILLDFAHLWNDRWVAKDDNRYLAGLLAATVGCYLAVVGGLAYMFVTFKPKGAGPCHLNMTIITLTLLAVLAFSLLSLHPGIKKGSLFPAAVISLYSTYLCFSAMSSLPLDDKCNGLQMELGKSSATSLAVGMVLTLLSVVYSALRLGSSSDQFTGFAHEDADEIRETLLEEAPLAQKADRDDGAGADAEEGGKAVDEFVPVSYNYTFFHTIFALAACYVAMMLTAWASPEAMTSDRIDVGMTSMWMKVASQWAIVALYVWSLVAPLLFPDRDFD